MPKGEHFKKPNPRIIQVSFKVNQKEFDQLQALVKEQNTSVAKYFRSIITGDLLVSTESTTPEQKAVAQAPETPKTQPKQPEKPKQEVVKPKPKHHDPTVSPNQMSLF